MPLPVVLVRGLPVFTSVLALIALVAAAVGLAAESVVALVGSANTVQRSAVSRAIAAAAAVVRLEWGRAEVGAAMMGSAGVGVAVGRDSVGAGLVVAGSAVVILEVLGDAVVDDGLVSGCWGCTVVAARIGSSVWASSCGRTCGTG